MQRIVVYLFLITTASILVQCTPSEKRPANTVVVGIQSAPATLDPRFAKDANGMRIGSLIFQSLVKIGPDLKLVGDAAIKWQWKDKTISFLLHEGLTFSNSRPLSAKDIIFSFSEYQKPENPFHSSLELLEKVEVRKTKEGLWVDLHMKKYSAKLLTADLPMIRLLPAEEIQQHEENFKNNPIGTGSFDLAPSDVNQIQLVARSTHPVAIAKVKKVQFKVVKNSFTLYQKLKKGEVDIVQSDLPLNKIVEFENQPKKFQVFKYPGLSFSYLLINHNDPVLKQKSVRQAIAHAINRNALIKFKMEGYASPATSLMTPKNPFHDKSLENPKFDIAMTKKLIKNKPIKLLLKTSSNQQAVETGKVLVQQLKDAGFQVNLKSFEWGTYFSDVQNGRFQLATMRWIGAVDPDLYRMAFHSRELPPGRNRGAYSNNVLDQLLDEGLALRNFEQRVKHYYKVQKIIHEDLAIIPLWYNQQVSVVTQRVLNYKPSLNGDYSPLLQLDILQK